MKFANPTLTSLKEEVGGGGYQILDPDYNYLGKSYSDYTTDWFNWFLSANADRRNSGPVVFLRSKPIPDRSTQSYLQGIAGTVSASNPNVPSIYVNEPNYRTGPNKLQIFEDQAVFVPIIVAFGFANTVYKDWGYLQDYTGLLIDNGDNPPEPMQLTINSESVKLSSLSGYRITTPIFMAVVPDAPYGTSVKDFLEGEVSHGSYPTMLSGYFVLLKFTRGNYLVHSWASAGREVGDPYFSELLYEIDVGARAAKDPHGRITTRRPAFFEDVATRFLKKLEHEGDPSFSHFKSIQDSMNSNLKQAAAANNTYAALKLV
jgi:hypothetical protein